MRRAVKASARAAQEVALAGRPGVRPWLITLTYRDIDAWRARHVSSYVDCLRKWGERRGFTIPYVWVAELQKRGAVHYHLVAWIPKGLTVPKGDKQGWWPHGMTQRVRAVKPTGYLMKYATKGEAAQFPRSLRLHGAGGLSATGRQVRRWLCLPQWLVARARVFQRVLRLPGGLWLLEETGELLRSPWEFVAFDAKAGAVEFRRRDQAQPYPVPVL